MVELYLFQMAAVSLCELACGEHGRSKDEPQYLEVVEGRDVGARRKGYSSCADLGHWLLFRLGLRERWINRDENGGWKDQVNLSALAWCPIAKPFGSAADLAPPEAGDICVVWNNPKGEDGHVLVCLGPGEEPGHIRTANYGAGGMSAAASPGANIVQSPFVHTANGWMVGAARPRKLQRIIKLADALKLIKATPNLTGADVTGELIDALGAGYGTEQ